MATIKEQREKLQERIAALQAREKALAAKDRAQERKARTKRLIELGAAIESKFSADAIFVLRNATKEQLSRIDKEIALCKDKLTLKPTTSGTASPQTEKEENHITGTAPQKAD